MVAATALKPDRAGFAAGVDVRRFDASAEKRGDGSPFIFDELGCGTQRTSPVHHHVADAFDRLALAVVSDAVVALGDGEVAVVHQSGEHIDGSARVGMILCVGVAQRVGDQIPPIDEATGVGEPSGSRAPVRRSSPPTGGR